MSRPSEYRPEYCDRARSLAKQGATDPELADYFGVSTRSIANWKVKHPEFMLAVKIGKGVADDRVEHSLYQRATGYTYDAVKIFMPGGATEPVYATYQEHCPPDATAMIFWLKNRRPEAWRDRRETELTGRDGGPIQIAGMNNEDLRRAVLREAMALGMTVPAELELDATKLLEHQGVSGEPGDGSD